MVGHPNEAYSQLQSDLRFRFPDLQIAVMNVVNGHYGYLPPRHLYCDVPLSRLADTVRTGQP